MATMRSSAHWSFGSSFLPNLENTKASPAARAAPTAVACVHTQSSLCQAGGGGPTPAASAMLTGLPRGAAAVAAMQAGCWLELEASY